MSNGYNGWTNWETWLTNMHMFDGVTARDINGWNAITADEARAYVQDYMHEVEGPNAFVADIIGGFMSEVDWREIAEHLSEDVGEGDE